MRESQPRQAGFTLIELMVAMTVGLLLLSVVFGMIYQTAGMAETMAGQMALNREARENFRLLTDGGVGSTGQGVTGFRGRTKASAAKNFDPSIPPVPEIGLHAGYRLQMSDAATPLSQLKSQQVSVLPVTCRGVGDPLADCAGTETKTVDGYLASPPTMFEPALSTLADRWAVITWKLVNPFQAGSRFAGAGEYRETYHTIINLAKEAD